MNAEPEMPLEVDNKGPENKTPEATEFGESEKEQESKMMREMKHSDSVYVGEEFEPVTRNMKD